MSGSLDMSRVGRTTDGTTSTDGSGQVPSSRSSPVCEFHPSEMRVPCEPRTTFLA